MRTEVNRKDPGSVFNDLSEHATEFIITDQHLTLMQQMYVRWEWVEFGAPAIDGKRPYGNSDVLGDLVELLGIEDQIRDHNPDMDEDALYDAVERYKTVHEEDLVRWHAETGIVLQIALTAGEFRAGSYRRERSWERWELVPS